MATILMNIDGFEIAHEAHMLEEYGEEKKRAEWKPQLALAGNGAVARINRHASDAAPPSALEEEIECFVLLPSAAFPRCP
ncbi:MAG: hypothetical protein Q7U91_14360 [Sideroxyarcus sp.]|nr:hypothetical protein [Sideroxyarcus sp.]